MFCKNCGKEVSDGTTLCPQCGNKIGGDDSKIKYMITAGVCCVLVLVVAGIFVSGFFAGRSERDHSSGNDFEENTTVSSDDKSYGGSATTAQQKASYSASPDKIINSIYEMYTMDFFVSDATEVDLNDALGVKAYLGLGDGETTLGADCGVEKACFSEALISSMAYSLVIAKVSDENQAERIKSEMFDGIDMAKWICVEADQLRVVSYNDIIMLVMISSQLDGEAADELVKAFAEAVSGSKVDNVNAVLTGEIFSKG